MMKSVNFKYIIFALILVVAGCRKDERIDGPVVVVDQGDPTFEVVSGVTGLVTNEDGIPVVNASVSIYNKQAKTDENGIFYVNNVTLNKLNSYVRVEKAGYFDGFKTFIPALGKKSFVQFQLVSKGGATSFTSANGGNITVSGGAEIIIPADGVVTKTGMSNYNGDVNVFAHWYNPLDRDLGQEMPGNLLGIGENSEEVQLASYGMVAVELVSPQGEALQLKADTKAVLKFPVVDLVSPPPMIPLWYFDELDGVWVQEGTAVYSDGIYTAEVSHFSFWNCDAPFPLVKIEGRLVDKGVPIANLPVTITLDNLISGYGYTDNEGVFRGKVPKGENLLLSVRNCGQTIINQELGAINNDGNIGDIEVELLNFSTVVQGRMVDCFGDPLQNAYGLVMNNDKVEQVITAFADGTFLSTIGGCENEAYTVQFFDPENLKQSLLFDIEGGIDVNDLMDVRICDGLDEFIRYDVNGMETPLILTADVYFSNQNKLIIRSMPEDETKRFEMDVFATLDGDYNPSTMSLLGNEGFPQINLLCGDHVTNAFGCEQVEVNISEFGDYVSGTFSGILAATKDSLDDIPFDYEEYTINGSFRLRIDEYINTGEISGQFWFDENNNDARDDGEDLPTRIQRISLFKDSGDGPTLFPRFIYAYSQSYKFTDLTPGTYTVRVQNYNGYDPVQKDVGSDDRDSDFNLINGVLIADQITITVDENFENVDLGYQLPDNISCSDLSYFGCVPGIVISTSISGGVPPFTASLSDGQTAMFYSNALFTVSDGGVYIMEVMDALGNSCTSEGSVNLYNNTIRGRVWRDIDGGNPNVYDTGDFLLSDITIRLYTESGNLAGGTVCQGGSYLLANVAPGYYYVEVDVPSNYQVVAQDVDISTGNDIDPNTNRSELILVGDCNSFLRIDAGLRIN